MQLRLVGASTFTKLNAEPVPSTPEEFTRFIRDDLARWTKLVRTVGVKHE